MKHALLALLLLAPSFAQAEAYDLEAWAIKAMLAKEPPAIVSKAALPGHEETEEQVRERFKLIAHAAVVVGKTRSNVAAMLAVTWHESGWAHDVDVGPCYRGKSGKGPRCDGGLSACIGQIRLGAGTTKEGWSKDDLFADREKCLTVTLRLINQSRAASKEPDHAFDVYASGHSGTTKASRQLFDAVRAFEAFP